MRCVKARGRGHRVTHGPLVGAVALLAASACGGNDSTVLLPPRPSEVPEAPAAPLPRPDEPTPEPEPLPTPDESNWPEPERRTGFIDLEAAEYSWLYPVSYVTRNDYGITTQYRDPGPRASIPARLFYNLIPADSDAKSRPVFVIFNGGYGSTSMYLHSLGTGPFALSEDDWSSSPAPNPYSLTTLGNLLYIDARLAGFSYTPSDAATDEAERSAAFDEQSLNQGRDAADFIHVLLRVLAEQPALQNNPVVLLGESAGGTRAAIMLELLLDPPREPDEARLYDDVELDAAIAEHYAAVFGADAVVSLSPSRKARQFGWQVLIQPGVLPNWQLGVQEARAAERLERLATLPGFVGEEGCEHRGRPGVWCRGRDAAVERAMVSPLEFEAVIGVDPRAVSGLPAQERGNGFRCQDADCGGPDSPILVEPSPAWTSALGEVGLYDSYFMTFVESGFGAGALYQERNRFSFLRVTPYVETLVTNALWDRSIDSEAIVPTLREYIAAQATPWLEAAGYDGADPDQVSETIVLRYADHPDYGPARSRRIRFPAYRDSGHMVPATEPEKFRDDVGLFLEQTGAITVAP
jgi:hypothetical protein